MKSRTPEMEAWAAEWAVGTDGIYGGRYKHEVTVADVEWERGFPTLRLVEKGTGQTYYCKYGWRHDLKHKQ